MLVGRFKSSGLSQPQAIAEMRTEWFKPLAFTL